MPSAHSHCYTERVPSKYDAVLEDGAIARLCKKFKAKCSETRWGEGIWAEARGLTEVQSGVIPLVTKSRYACKNGGFCVLFVLLGFVVVFNFYMSLLLQPLSKSLSCGNFLDEWFSLSQLAINQLICASGFKIKKNTVTITDSLQVHFLTHGCIEVWNRHVWFCHRHEIQKQCLMKDLQGFTNVI